MISFVLTLKRLISAIFRIGKEPLFRTLLLTLAIILLSGTLFYHQTEGWTLLNSFYFAFVSLIPTGINTGLAPEASLSKWFTMIYLIVGVGVMLMLLIRLGFAIIKLEKPEDDQHISVDNRNEK
ncbi:two pore domain potassium channel family protein [Salinicoccus sp. ID82-1]|uniref:Two pore domain potassium channel family protein n=1 Tax=Salinicoccus cyprini TaxID=2493691 RepID=A0A558AR02_9STAP|nr:MULTISPECIES: potassium channel family protein [Salinicoccus]MCG1010274.1 two pore domain potassium channel family protein [Salinicoccus sp. ID82-1]TVT26672.1 two pore domain potassium channel family protein [Salinicoccus cyprini]